MHLRHPQDGALCSSQESTFSFGLPLLEKAKNVTVAQWAICKERNRVVCENLAFYPNRMKLSFIRALISLGKINPYRGVFIG